MRHQQGPQLYLRSPRRKGGARRWVILDRDANGRRCESSTGAFEDDRTTAEKAFAAYLAKKHIPNFGGGDPAQVLISDVMAFYSKHKAEQSYRNDSMAGSLLKLGEFFADKRVSDVTPLLCQQYIAWRIQQGDARGANRRDGKVIPRLLKPTTARNDLIVLDAAQRYCWCNHKLAQFVPIAKGEPSKARVRFLTTSEAARLLAAALGWDQHGLRHPRSINRHLARFILIGLYTGTRRDRILRLQWTENLHGGWVDLDRGILHRKSKAEPETKKRAPSVPLSDRMLVHLRRWRWLTARYVIEFNGAPIHGVFTGFEAASRLAGLNYDGQPEDDRVTPHTLRHTCVSWALAEGKSPLQVGQYVGMTAAIVEKTYAHTNHDLQRETANAIGRRTIPGSSHTRPTQLPKRA
jgi:integrase